MRVFGLTGGIASGKSTVASRFEARGVPVVDADVLARVAVEPGSARHAKIVEAFGPDVLDASGGIDRAKLGAIVFADASARARLNTIVHPEVARLAMDAFARLAAEGHALACYEVPLLVENGLAPMFRPVVVVAVEPEAQVARMMGRDGLDATAARARIASQAPLDEKLRVADVVIRNDAGLDALVARSDEALDAVRVFVENAS